jgi:hypothetical protein
VLDTCDWTATSAKFFGRYLRASARDIARREYPRPYGATKDTACRCYLRGPDGVSGLTPSGTWGKGNIVVGGGLFNCQVRLPAGGRERSGRGLRASVRRAMMPLQTLKRQSSRVCLTSRNFTCGRKLTLFRSALTGRASAFAPVNIRHYEIRFSPRPYLYQPTLRRGAGRRAKRNLCVFCAFP